MSTSDFTCAGVFVTGCSGGGTNELCLVFSAACCTHCFRSATWLAVGFPSSGEVEALSLERPTRLAFSKKRSIVYVGSAKDKSLHAIDVQTRKELWATPVNEVEQTYFRLESSNDDSRLLISS